MANKVLSIEIGSSVIRVCLLDYKKKNPKVYRHVTVPTPVGAINDGYLNDIDALSSAITAAINENNMKKTKYVVFTAESSKILTREIIVPPLKENMIGNYVKTNSSEYFPIEISGHQVSHLVLERIKDGEDAGKSRVLVMAAERELVDDYEQLAMACDLTLLELDYVGNSIIQAFKNEEPLDRVMILKVEETQTSISILYDGNLLLQRSINYGIGEIIQEVANRPAFGVSKYDEAWELVKRKTCVRGSYSNATAVQNKTDADEKDDSVEVFEAKKAVTAAAMPFINAVMRVLDFYNSRSMDKNVEQIFVCGMGGDFSGLSKLIKNEVGIKTNVLKKMKEIEWVANDDGNDTGLHNYAACFGATFAPVGFYSKEAVDKERHQTNFTGVSILLGVLTLTLIASLGFLSSTAYGDAKNENERLLALQAKYAASEKYFHKYEAVQKTYEEVYTGSLMVNNPNDNLLNFFAELEQKLPADAIVIELASSNDFAKITLRVADEDVATSVVDKLRTFESVMNVNTGGLEVVSKELVGPDGEPLLNEDGTIMKESYVEISVYCFYFPSEFTVATSGKEV